MELVSGRKLGFRNWRRTINAPTLRSMTEKSFPATEYFLAVRARPDRAIIRDDWIRQVIGQPIRVTVQADGRLRLWAEIAEAGGRVLRVVLLPDRLTVHNAFFDRSYKP
jgi:hypothetical protein